MPKLELTDKQLKILKACMMGFMDEGPFEDSDDMGNITMHTEPFHESLVEFDENEVDEIMELIDEKIG